MIVAGFGRFGQVVVRVLRGLGIRATVIDHDPEQIETVRRFGFKAYYGDATRMDLLESAGARKGKLLLVAIDDPEAAMRMVKNPAYNWAPKLFKHQGPPYLDAITYRIIPEPAAEVVLPCGLVVRVPIGADPAAVARLVTALGAPPC